VVIVTDEIPSLIAIQEYALHKGEEGVGMPKISE
jgi:hypothetical protein